MYLESDEWIVALDTKKGVHDLIDGLKDQGGYAITHMGGIRRADGGSFSFNEANGVLQAVYFFLSFVRGLWCGPILASGRKSGLNVWQEWADYRLTPWKYVESWFPRVVTQEGTTKLGQAFRGFMQKWNNNLWRDPIKYSIHWYVESNIDAGGVEGAIVLTQTALELLSWLYFVEEPATATCSVGCFEKVNAATKIRKLLNAFGIPVSIPAGLKNLQSEAATLQVPDGPEAFVRLRNTIVHPKESKRKVMLQTSVRARMEAKDLGLWYLELVLLRIFGYDGKYHRRVERGSPDQVIDKVPWT